MCTQALLRSFARLLVLFFLASLLFVLAHSTTPNTSAESLAAPPRVVSLTVLGSPYSQDFNSLASSGTGNVWTDDTTIVGWYSTRTTYDASTGTSTSGALYSFGTAVSDRALGSVCPNTSGNIYYGVRLQNNTGATTTLFLVSYTGEQWRDGYQFDNWNVD